MDLFLFPILVIYFTLIPSGLSGDVSSRPSVLNIGALLTYNSTIGRVAMVAIDAAVNDVNSDPRILQGTRLVVQMQDSDCCGSIGVIEAIQFMETDVVAIIGPQSSAIAHVISYIGTVLQVPLLSFAATDPSLSSLQYPFFVQTTQSDLFQMAAVADIVDYYQWKHVTAIFVDDDYGRNGIASLGDRLAERGSKISYKASLPLEATRTDIINLLIQVAFMESRVIVLHVHTNIGLIVFSEAHRLGMLERGYVWIATDWLSSLLDSSASLGSDITDMMQGVIALRQNTRDSKFKSALVSNWRKLTKNRTGGDFQLNSYGFYAYDTVWVIARALDALFNDNVTISFSNNSSLHDTTRTLFDGGKLLLNKILKTDFVGVTGRVRFNADRHLIRPVYDILNVVGTGFRTIGYWSNYSGLSVASPETVYSYLFRQLYNVIWPGETATRPLGWAFPRNGKELRVGVPRRVLFQEFVAEDESDGTMRGYCIDVFSAALNLLPYAVPYRFIPFGSGQDNPKYDELIEMVASNIYDAAVGDITIVTKRTKMVDFTQPYIESRLAVMAAVAVTNSSGWVFLQPFTLEMWCFTVLSLLVVGGVVSILEHRINDEFRGPPKKQLCTVFWFGFSTLFFAHKETAVSTLGRAVLIIWLFVVLIIQSSYTASLTSILTVQQLSSPIKGIDSLISSNDPIGFQVGSFVENYLVEELGISRSRLRPLESRDGYVRALDLGPNNGGVAAVVDERPYIDVILSTRCNFAVVGSDFTGSGWGFAFQKDSPLAVDMSTAILSLSENGDLQRIRDKWLSGGGCNTQNSQPDSDQIHPSSFSGLFLICGSACIVALLVYFCLILRQFLRRYPPKEDEASGHGNSCQRIVRNFFSFADEEDDAKNRFKRRQTDISNTESSGIDIERDSLKIEDSYSSVTNGRMHMGNL